MTNSILKSISEEPAVKVQDLAKVYGKVEALHTVSMQVRRGELFGIIGPDGAGKTTLFRILATLLSADRGTASVDGLDIKRDYKQIRTRIGYMPGKFSLYPDLTVMENLQFFASVFGTTIQKNYHLIQDIYSRLEPFANRKAAKLSGGMKQKLALCCALIHAPSVLFLDEPTTGVDPSSRREFWEMLAHLKSFGITMLVSTAYMDEANRCDRVAMMQTGRFMITDTPQAIIQNFDKTLLAVRSDEMFRLLHDLREIAEIKTCYTFGDVHHITLLHNSILTPQRIERILIEDAHHQHVVVSPCKATMEDCYMNLEEK